MNQNVLEQDGEETPGPRYEREDWTLFRTVSTISQAAGVPKELLRKLVAKELADNALDVSDDCRVGLLPNGGFFVEDDGPGIRDTPDAIARLFSFRRPLISSKVIRLPSRGALGNGLRVVAGAVFASGGRLTVITNGQRLDLSPQESGETVVSSSKDVPCKGTRIEVWLGVNLPQDHDVLEWAEAAIQFAGRKRIYSGKTSAWWYESDSFFELLKAGGQRTVCDVMQQFDGSRSGASAFAQQFRGRLATSLTYEEAEDLLKLARSTSAAVEPNRLKQLGKDLPGSNANHSGLLQIHPGRGGLSAHLPYTVEASCDESLDEEDEITVLVNRTPVTEEMKIRRAKEKTAVFIFGCNLGHKFTVGRKPVSLVLNVQIPYMPITSNGKQPDLQSFHSSIRTAIETAARKWQRANPTSKNFTQNDVIRNNLSSAIRHASGSGKYRFSLRQLFYAIRPRFLAALDNKEPDYGWFTKVIADYETENGDIPGMYRDDRGVLYHPHLKTTIPLGTLSVERYERPDWTFNKILYCEKEGLFPVLQAANWPERHDCALLTSKGHATKAAKDIIDLLGDTDEEILFYVIHDGDAYGTGIVQALQEATRSRPERSVEIINLGLEPEEGLAMGLPVETLNDSKKQKPVASYVPPEWAEWLQTKRIELNAMTSPQFIEWLDQKMAKHGEGKVIPPPAVMTDYLRNSLRDQIEENTRERILREADLAGQVQTAMNAREATVQSRSVELENIVADALEGEPSVSWRKPIKQLAVEVAK